VNPSTPHQVILSPRAFNDLDSIFDYISARSPKGTIKTIDQLWQASVGLRDFPRRHRIFQKASKTRPETRVMPVDMYLVYYRVIESQRLVRILTIRHGARRQPRQFGE
jgi:addiction module RelE/StbE family toxin